MTREEAKANLNMISVAFVEPVTKEQKKLIDDTFDVAIQSLTAISELSKSLKAVNRYEMDEKVLIGFNMAVAIFNKCFGESCALKNEQTDGDLISRKAVITMLNKIENAVEDGDGFQFNEWIDYAKDIPSAEKTAKWISVSERLPDKVGIYITTVDYDQYGTAVGQRFYHGESIGWEDNRVIAWMPLPEPYKADKEEE